MHKNLNFNCNYTAKIDFLDVIEINKLPLVNERAVLSDNPMVKETYRHNIFLQVVLGTVNGVTLKQE